MRPPSLLPMTAASFLLALAGGGGALGGIQPVKAWSAVGHEITATLAQIHLTPMTAQHVARLLPPEARGQLAVVASWADTIRGQRPETGPSHYINALADVPPDNCTFGGDGWANGEVNVLEAIGNWTRALQDGEGDIPLRFLTHLLADLHQPLHLTGLLRGGNAHPILFQGRRTSLHALWDGVLLNRAIRELGGWTGSGDGRVERALRGRVYDPLVRFIVFEGIRKAWREESLDWPLCPDYDDDLVLAPSTDASPSSWGSGTAASSDDANAPKPPSIGQQQPFAARPPPLKPPLVDTLMHLLGVPPWMYDWLLPEWMLSWTPGAPPTPLHSPPSTAATDRQAADLTGHPGGTAAALAPAGDATRPPWIGRYPNAVERDASTPGCPFAWAKETHPLNCAYVWPPTSHSPEDDGKLLELDTPEYYGRLKADLVVEKQLAKGGIRLAAVLNSLFDPDYRPAALFASEAEAEVEVEAE